MAVKNNLKFHISLAPGNLQSETFVECAGRRRVQATPGEIRVCTGGEELVQAY